MSSIIINFYRNLTRVPVQTQNLFLLAGLDLEDSPPGLFWSSEWTENSIILGTFRVLLMYSPMNVIASLSLDSYED